MGLKIWLPLDGDLHNQGTSNPIITQTTATQYVNNGKIGKAVGAGAIKIDATTAASILNNNEFSFCCWVYVNADAGDTTKRNNFFGDGSTGQSYSRHYTIFQYPNCNALHIDWRSNNVGKLNGVWENVLPSYQWTHIAITYKNPNFTLYLNGNKYATKTGVLNETSYAYETPLFENVADNGRYLNDYRIYDNCLSAAEVHEIAQGLVLHYKLDQNINVGENLMPNSLVMPLGSANPSTGTWRNAGTSNMTRSRVAITDTPEGSGYGFQNSGIQTANDGSCYGIDSFPLEANTNYIISMWARITAGTEGYAGFNVYASTPLAGWQVINKNYYSTKLATDGSWTKCWMSFKTNSATTRNIYIGITTGDTNVTTQMCNVHIEKGSLADYNIITDSSGYERNGEIIGSPIISQETVRYNNSLLFNGLNDGILISNKGLNKILNNSFTISFWIKSIGENGGRSIYFSSYSGSPFWCLEKSTGNAFRYDWNGSIDKYSNNNIIMDNTWYHLCFVRERTAMAKLYLNGSLNTTFSTATTDLSNLVDVWRIGRDVRSNDGTPFHGQMSDFRIYCTPLLDTDIKQLYNVGMKVDNLGGVHSFELNEQVDNQILDTNLNKDSNITSFIYDKVTNTHTITIPSITSTWGFGITLGTIHKLYIPWNSSYRLTMEVFSSTAGTFVVDYNNYADDMTDMSGNDNDNNRLADTVTIPANTWTRVTFGATNNNVAKNPHQLPLYDFSHFGMRNQNTNTSLTYQIRNVQWYLVDNTHNIEKNGILNGNHFNETSLVTKASIRNKEKSIEATEFIEM